MPTIHSQYLPISTKPSAYTGEIYFQAENVREIGLKYLNLGLNRTVTTLRN